MLNNGLKSVTFILFFLIIGAVIGMSIPDNKPPVMNDVIIGFNGSSYMAVDATEANGCVQFTVKNNGTKIKVCGSYSIIKNNK